MQMWVYDSPIGQMAIKYDVETSGYFIVINGDYYGKYKSAVAAADDVYTFSTGCSEWDDLCDNVDVMVDVPTDISEWQRVHQ